MIKLKSFGEKYGRVPRVVLKGECMKIALIGYGKMGRAIEEASHHTGDTIVARITAGNWDENGIAQADVCMEFTECHSTLCNIERLAALKKDVVIGTTGWEGLACVQKCVEKQGIGALYSPNFSLGVQLLLEIARSAGKLLNDFNQYDAAISEHHHHKKKDSPSGTALEMARVVKEAMTRIDTLNISSMRCGSIVGTHTLFFDSPCDTITISHTARSRTGFAEGALYAANWLQGRKGLYTFADCFRKDL